MTQGYSHMQEKELELAKRWLKEKKSLNTVAKLLGRDVKTVRRNLNPPAAGTVKPKGRPVAIDGAM
eukprot:8508292-Karenia_brevis.AAC.1